VAQVHQQTQVEIVSAAKVVDVINVAAPLELSVSKVENLARRTRVRKRYVKSSTIWRHLHLVVQLFHTVMEKQQLDCVAAQPSWILPRRLVAIQQR
jgi:hypothetical protein